MRRGVTCGLLVVNLTFNTSAAVQSPNSRPYLVPTAHAARPHLSTARGLSCVCSAKRSQSPSRTTTRHQAQHTSLNVYARTVVEDDDSTSLNGRYCTSARYCEGMSCRCLDRQSCCGSPMRSSLLMCTLSGPSFRHTLPNPQHLGPRVPIGHQVPSQAPCQLRRQPSALDRDRTHRNSDDDSAIRRSTGMSRRGDLSSDTNMRLEDQRAL